MRMDKLTSRFQQALSDAQSLAVGRDHNFIEPAHLLLALLDQQGGGTRPLLGQAGVNVPVLRERLTEALERMPKVTGQAGQLSVGNDLARLLNVTDKLHGEKFFVKLPDPKGSGRMVRFVTPLFLALVLIEFADLVFAVDSVPAIFAITTDPFIVYTSNIFAILGLRALYFALAAILHRFAYLKYALSLLLVFIGSKIFIADLMGWEKFPPTWSLGITFAILGVGVVYSLWKTTGDKAERAQSHPAGE